VVTMKNTVFWNVTLCGYCKNRCFGGTIPSIIRLTRIGELETMSAVTSNRSALGRKKKTQKTAFFADVTIVTTDDAINCGIYFW
jgi:hypothetical protein